METGICNLEETELRNEGERGAEESVLKPEKQTCKISYVRKENATAHCYVDPNNLRCSNASLYRHKQTETLESDLLTVSSNANELSGTVTEQRASFPRSARSVEMPFCARWMRVL